jgi:hypothetical protein
MHRRPAKGMLSSSGIGEESMRRSLTVALLALAAVAIAVAGVSAPRTRATETLCHSTALSISAASTVKAGKKLIVSGAEARSPDHTLTATIQYRKATATAWRNGAFLPMNTRSYSLAWKAPAKKGKYKLRVRVDYQGSSRYSATRTVTVK